MTLNVGITNSSLAFIISPLENKKCNSRNVFSLDIKFCINTIKNLYFGTQVGDYQFAKRLLSCPSHILVSKSIGFLEDIYKKMLNQSF